jgi:hypothetical protein
MGAVGRRRVGARSRRPDLESLESRQLLTLNASFAVGGLVATNNTAYFPPYADSGVFAVKATGDFDSSTHFSCVVNWGDGSDPQSIGSSYGVSDGSMNGFSTWHGYSERGAYQVSFELSDDRGDHATASCTYLMVATDTLVFTSQPDSGLAGSYMSEFEVSAEYGPGMIDDGYRNIPGSGYRYGSDVTFSLADAQGATLSGNTVVSMNDGVGHGYLKIDRPGTYQIVASGRNAVSGTSDPIEVVGTDVITFVNDPPTSGPTGTLAPVRVQVLKSGGQPEVGAAVTMTLQGSSGGTISGTTTATTDASGVATFGNLVIRKPGAGYTLTATCAAAGSVTGRAFRLIGDTLSFQAQPPASAPAGALDPVTVKLLRSDGSPDAGIAVSLTLHGGSGSAALSGTTP